MMEVTADRLREEERNGEMIINYFRISLGVLCGIGIGILAFRGGYNRFNTAALRWYSGPFVLIGYSIGLFWYLRKRTHIWPLLKYVFVVLDMGIASYTVIMIALYPSLVSPAILPSFQVSCYFLFIILSGLRCSVSCEVFSGIIAAVAYGSIVFVFNIYQYASEGMIGNQLIRDGWWVLSLIACGIIIAIILKRYGELVNHIFAADIISESADAAFRTVTQTKEIAGRIREATKEIAVSSKDIFTTANNQAATVEEIVSTINENTKIATDIADKTRSVATIAAKMEDDVLTGFSVLENNVKKMGDIKDKNEGVINGIVMLGQKITKIRDIVRVINTITDQTKVIAFNAALEAAGAGERGKRFAVVAEEVNRLADDIANLTKQIKEQVEEIQASSSSLIISSEEGADKIAEGYKLIKNLEDVFKDIRSGAEITSNQAQTITISTQKQRKSSEQIHLAISDISHGLNSFLHATEVATSSAEKLTNLAYQLELVLNGELDVDSVDPTLSIDEP
ncbi:MAG: methyl-accepting chemotaxis protein [Treponema sp.]|jgi:methyl-accepting chemotaxis protein|nr:methyl-accepting chemotaxis protein [Treponema sp.]